MKYFWRLAIPLLLGGCISTPKYPESWTPGFPDVNIFSKGGESCCLTGSYSDVGEPPQDQEGGKTVSLFHELFPRAGAPVAGNIDRVTFRGPEGGILEITAWKDGVPVESRFLINAMNPPAGCDVQPSGIYTCNEEGLINVLPGGGRSNTANVANVALVGSASDRFLFRGTDGWLVLRKNDLLMVLPWWVEYKTRWYRFSPLTPGLISGKP